MGHKLTANVFVRHPQSFEGQWLNEGDDLPDWAEPLVGSHAHDGADAPDADSKPASGTREASGGTSKAAPSKKG